MTATQSDGFEKIVEEAEMLAEVVVNKTESKKIQEIRKEQLYNGTKKMKHFEYKKK